MFDSLKAKLKLLKSAEVDQQGRIQAFDVMLQMCQGSLNPFQPVFDCMALGVIVRHACASV